MTQRVNDYKDLPALDSDEIEVSTIGVGSQEGEALVLHLGDGKWVIIDSCKANDGTVLPLHYLSSIGVKPVDVDKILCTHWHQDHINGLKTIVSNCPNAEFYFPVVGQANNYLRFLVTRNVAQGNSSVWNEFIGSVSAAGRRTAFSGADRLIFDNNNGVQLFALSPSDKLLETMIRIVARYNANGAKDTKINDNAISPNIGCTALLLVTPEENILLGADLESNRNKKKPIDGCVGKCTSRNEKGWCNVVDSGIAMRGKKVSLFKLPHHSSKTGYCEAIWQRHVTDDIVSVSTVFINNAGVKLPQKDMLEKYKTLSSSMYLTSRGPRKKERGNPNGRSMLDNISVAQIQNVAVLKEEIGVVCCRKKKGQPWQTYLLGSAIEVDDNFIKEYQV